MQRVPIVLIVISVLLVFASPIRAQQDQDDESTAQEQSTPSSQPKQDSSAQRERQEETSSSKDTRIDLSPPMDDAKKHPDSGAAMVDAGADTANDTGVSEMHPWDPHKAAKDVEVGDFYYKRKNYRAAIGRYKDALIYKPNDAEATFRLAESQDKTGDSAEAITHYQDYLKILPHGPFAADAQKALERLHAEAPGQGGSAEK